MSETFYVYYSERYKEHDTGAHPECAERMDAVSNSLREEKQAVQWMEPRMALEDELQLAHTDKHIDKIRSIAKGGGGHADPDTVVSEASYDIALLSAGAGLAAVDSVCEEKTRRAFVVSRPPGHHATSSRAMGFCLFNNIALSGRYAQTKHDVGKVLIVDFDVHHGNGTQDIFYEDPSVFYLSIHQHPLYPGTGMEDELGKGEGEGFTKNLPFPPATDPDFIVEAIEDSLKQIGELFKPNLVLISAGFDGHEKDPLANWILQDEHYRQLTELVLTFAEEYCKGKVISFLEGGYNLDYLGGSALAHAQAMMGD